MNKVVGKPILKKDSMPLVTGKPVYTDDVIPDDCLIVKLLRSPYANAIVKTIDTSKARKLNGVEAIFTWEDVDQDAERFTSEGEAYPETGPYDRLIIDRHVRYVGDVVAIIAAKDEKTANAAKKLIKVEYDILEPVLDFRKSLDNKVVIHPEKNWKSIRTDVGGDNMRNLVSSQETFVGKSISELEKECDTVVENTYHTQSCQQTAMETFRTYCSIDTYGRLYVITSTQVVYHCRKSLSYALHIPKSQIRVVKPRVGGGFGSKGSIVSEAYPAFVTWKTKKASKIIFTREESQTASSPRHEMQATVKVGATKDGTIKFIDLDLLSNAGAYGEHSPTTSKFPMYVVGSLYGRLEGYHCQSKAVYTNKIASGAYRGYGVTQVTFAIESAVNELAHKLNIDPFAIRLKNVLKEGEYMPVYAEYSLGTKPVVNTSCTLDKCLERAREMSKWDEKTQMRRINEHTVRCMGMAMGMQSSGIANQTVGGATIRMGDDACYSLSIASGEMGQGCDTTLAQIAAEVLQCDIDNIIVFGADTDTSPYDSGSYASDTAYVTGKAVETAALQLIERIKDYGAKLLDARKYNIEFDGKQIYDITTHKSISLADLSNKAMGGDMNLEVTVSHTSLTSPPPYMVGVVELEIDTDTGETTVVEFNSAIDCGTVLNPEIARGQMHGAIVQALGMALTEQISHDKKGKLQQNSFMQYKIPSRLDIGNINVEFIPSYEPTGPFGAKSIGEVGTNTSAPAVADAIYCATGVRFTELPIMPEHIVMGKQN